MERSELRMATGDTGVTNEVVSKLDERLEGDLVAAVLFGSRARGEACEGSDWDILVIARRLPERTLERAIRLKRMLPTDYRGEVSLLAKTPEEFISNLPDLYLDIALDGIVLYDADGRFHGEAVVVLEGADPAQGVAAREGGSGSDLALARASWDRLAAEMGGDPITGRKPTTVREPRWIAEIETWTQATVESPCVLRSCLTRSRVWRIGT